MNKLTTKSVALFAAKCLVIVLFAILLHATDDPLLMVGTDPVSHLISPSITVQIVCFVVFSATLLVPAALLTRAGLLGVALGAALLGSHRLVVDDFRYEIRDVYLAISVQSLPLDPSNEEGLSLAVSAVGFRIGQKGTGRTLWCFSPGRLGLDPAELASLPPDPS